MDASQVKCRKEYLVVSPDPRLSPERCTVLRRQPVEISAGVETWFVVRFADGARLTVHPFHFREFPSITQAKRYMRTGDK